MKVKELSRIESTFLTQNIEETKSYLESGGVFIIRQMVDPTYVSLVRDYLAKVGANSLPAYHPIVEGCPNFHRVNKDDERSYVRATFHQFSFFPWNQDLFDLFSTLKPIFELRNLLSKNPKDAYLGKKSENGCIGRISFQFYPQGGGMMNLHKDPEDYHQFTVPTLCMSKKGVDFETGGAFFEMDGKRHFVDDLCDLGDVTLFHARHSHGVAPIDPNKKLEWHKFLGRWVALAAVNKLSSNSIIKNAEDLGK